MRTSGLTRSQLARRERIVGAAIRRAAEGGYEGVQMRTVATDAEVALGTLYRYFPSKEHLLVSVMLQEVGSLAERLERKPPRGERPVDRVIDVLERATRGLLREPQLTAALCTALVSADPEVGPVVRQVRERMHEILVRALGDEVPDATRIADVLEHLWLAALVGWIGGVAPASSVVAKLEDAARLVLDR